MRFKTLFLLVLIVSYLLLIGCSVDRTNEDKINGKLIGKELKDVLPSPDKIIVYKDGNQKDLEKTDPRFNEIVKLTNGRFHNKLSTALDVVDDDFMINIRKDGLGLEFVYPTEKELSVKGDGFQPFTYDKLYFQLTSQRYGNEQGSIVHTFQHSQKDHYVEYSRGALKYSEELVNLVKGI